MDLYHFALGLSLLDQFQDCQQLNTFTDLLERAA